MRQQGGFFYWVKIIMILALVSAGFFYGQKVLASQNILINEIMYDVAGSDTDKEWVEIYNAGSEEVTIVAGSGANSWRFNDGSNHILTLVQGSLVIPSGGYAIIASNGAKFVTDHPNYSGTVLNSIMFLNNTSDTLKLSADKGMTFFGEITYQNTWGSNGNGKTLERQNNSWIESAVVGGTPGAANSMPVVESPSVPFPAVCGNGQTESGEQCDDGNLASGDGCSSTCQAETATSTPEQTEADVATSTTPLIPPLSGGQKNNFGDVLINEFVADPADEDVEWIEIYNKTNHEIDLAGWWIEEGSKAKTNLSGSLGVSGSGRYKIIEKPAGNLNNSGDLIILYEPSGKIIDQIAYGNWDDGNLEDNAFVAADPKSLARKFDGYNTYNNLNDFSLTIKPTKGASNIIEAEDEVSSEAKAKFDFSNDIFISEILPNPMGDDSKLEFIEIYNAGQREVNLAGWSLSNKDDKKVNLEKIATSTIIKVGEYLAVFRPRSKIVLHNDQGQVKLFQPLADKPFMSVDYKNVKEGWSYNLENPPNPLYQGGNWVWSETVTPGAMNVFKTVNHAPEVEFNLLKEILAGAPVIFDSSDTFDQDGDELKFSWDFGDGFKNNLANPEHTYFKIGIYKVKLEVNDGKEIGTKEKSVKVVSSVSEMTNVLDSRLRGNDKIEEVALNDKIIINEIFPNPAGADENNEWLELKNQSADKINFLNWRVENSNGKYKFKNDLWLDAANFYSLTNQESKLAFKNADDIISLYNDLDELVDQVEYANAVQDETYARGANGKWFWTTVITPGAENIIRVSISQNEKITSAGVSGNQAEIIETTLEKISQYEVGDLLKVKGKVAVLPGILGAQYFYIVGSPGLQVYNYKKEFPGLLKIGDYIEVVGELGEINGERRLKTKSLADIKILEHQSAPTAQILSCDKVGEEYTGQLISVSGEVTDRKSSTVYLDDGNDEIAVYLKQATGIKPASLEEGKTYAIVGIVAKTQSGLRLMPRSSDDIVIKNQTAEAGSVLGEVAVGDEWEVAARDKKLELFKYLLVIAAGVIILLVGLMIKIWRNKGNKPR
jgi:cysteine-rich repeat protein